MRQDGQTHLLLVEGASDLAFYKHHLDSEARPWLLILPVEQLEVYAEWLEPGEALSSNRTLVAAATRYLCADWNVRGVIDRDCGVPESWRDIECLLVTDYPGLESYAFTDRVMSKVLMTLRLRESYSGAELREDLHRVLHRLFHLRQEVGGLGGVAHDKLVEFDGGNWIVHYHKVGVVKVAECRSLECLEDLRGVCYGHDLAPVLMVKFGNRLRNQVGWRTPEGLERALLGFVERTEIQAEPLMVGLESWLAVEARSFRNGMAP